MGISLSTVQFLREAGHDVVHLREEGLHQLPDSEILAKAYAEQRIVLTCDLDFGDLLAASGATLPSVILLRLKNYTPDYVNPRISEVITACEQLLQNGAIVIVQDTRYRVRTLPIE